jgi:hypothetical protein
MKGNINEIAGIINECFYYFNRINYQAKNRYSIDTSFSKLREDTYKQFQETNRQRADFINKIRLIDLETKPVFTQLIFDLNHLFKFSIFDNCKQTLTNGKFTRLKYGSPKDVESLKDAIFFFRDAIVHPEHSTEKPSPRALPQFPNINLSLYSLLIKNGTDFCFQIGEGKIRLKADILKCLKNLKEQCLKSDSENILKNFKWVK